MTQIPIQGVILAAGEGKRMKSALPKCLHQVCGVPMIRMVISAMQGAGLAAPVVVVGHGREKMLAELGAEFPIAVQDEQKGTGHAVLCAFDALEGDEGLVLIACGDVPMIRTSTVKKLIDTALETGAEGVLATVKVSAPKGYGRITRDENDHVTGIVEEKDATEEQRAINEINPALYCFSLSALRKLLPTVEPSPTTGELYLTEMIRLIRENGGTVRGIVFEDEYEFQGVNDRNQLAQASKTLRMRILRELGESGVTIVDPDSTFIGGEVTIAPDTTILPMTVIDGKTSIGSGCAIGPNTWIKDSILHDDVRVFMSHLDQAEMESGSRCGPFANLRPDTKLGKKVKVGNFVEIKKSSVGEGTSISHLTYIGDAKVGSKANIGAGTITCNYDGYAKHLTQIGDGAFVGSNSTLVAPVNIGAGAITAAGSVITGDVPADSLGIGRARQENKEEWAKKFRQHRTQSDSAKT